MGLIFGILQYFLRVLLAIEHASADIFMHFVSVGATLSIHLDHTLTSLGTLPPVLVAETEFFP